jgi:hypothetical protein
MPLIRYAPLSALGDTQRDLDAGCEAISEIGYNGYSLRTSSSAPGYTLWLSAWSTSTMTTSVWNTTRRIVPRESLAFLLRSVLLPVAQVHEGAPVRCQRGEASVDI